MVDDDQDENWDCYSDDWDDEDLDDDKTYCVAPGSAGFHSLCTDDVCHGMGTCMYVGSGR
jgi:hypothetical protein